MVMELCYCVCMHVGKDAWCMNISNDIHIYAGTHALLCSYVHIYVCM